MRGVTSVRGCRLKSVDVPAEREFFIANVTGEYFR